MRTKCKLLAATTLRPTAAFDPGWKMDGDHIAVDGSGNPVWIDGSDREMSVGGDTISRLNGEAKGHRERAERAEAELKKFEGITDPAAALKAIETVGKLDAKQLIDAGKVDEVRAEITRNYETQLGDLRTQLSDATGKISGMRLDGAFKGSEFIRDNIAMPTDFFQAAFKDRFKDENGKLVAYGADGNPVYSTKRAGELADFDEALSIFVANHPAKDQILKAPDARGSGNQGGGGARGGGRIVKRSDFDTAAPAQQAQWAQQAGAGEIRIVD